MVGAESAGDASVPPRRPAKEASSWVAVSIPHSLESGGTPYLVDGAHYFAERKPSTTVSLDSFLTEKIATLRSLTASVEEDICQRSRVSTQVLAAINEHYRLIKTKRLGLDHWPQFGLNPVIDQKKSELERQLDLLHHEARQETITHAESIARLRAEWRTWWKQYRDLSQRAALLQGSTQPK